MLLVNSRHIGHPGYSPIYLIDLYYNDVIKSAMASQITGVSIVYSAVRSGADQENTKAPRQWHLWGEFTGGPNKGPVTRKIFPFDDVIMGWEYISATKTSNSYLNLWSISIYIYMICLTHNFFIISHFNDQHVSLNSSIIYYYSWTKTWIIVYQR